MRFSLEYDINSYCQGQTILCDTDGFPSGQRGQTVNLLATLSVVRIHLHPFCRSGGTGRRTGLKILRDLYSRTGSIPVCGSFCEVLQTLVNRGLEAFFIFFKKLYKVVQPVNIRVTPISLPFERYLFLLHADRYSVVS